MSAQDGWTDVAAVGEVGDNEVRGFVAAGTPIALFNLGGELFALHDRCTHGQARLSEGFVEDGNVECPLHQGLVCIRTGEPKAPPIRRRTATYPTRIVAGRVQVLLGVGL